MSQSILVLGDLHAPFVHAKSLARAIKLASLIKPKIIVQIGDLYDLYAFSKYPRSLDLMTPKQEINEGLEVTCRMWRELRKASPKSKCFQMIGNHDSRPVKRLIEKTPELERFLDLSSLYDFPNVTMVPSERDELIIGDILFMHGFRSKLGDHARHNGKNTVCGHSHRGGVVYHRLGDKTLWELNAGFLANEKSYALSYTRQAKISTWTQGVGLIDELGPRFIPFANT